MGGSYDYPKLYVIPHHTAFVSSEPGTWLVLLRVTFLPFALPLPLGKSPNAPKAFHKLVPKFLPLSASHFSLTEFLASNKQPQGSKHAFSCLPAHLCSALFSLHAPAPQHLNCPQPSFLRLTLPGQPVPITLGSLFLGSLLAARALPPVLQCCLHHSHGLAFLLVS